MVRTHCTLIQIILVQLYLNSLGCWNDGLVAETTNDNNNKKKSKFTSWPFEIWTPEQRGVNGCNVCLTGDHSSVAKKRRSQERPRSSSRDADCRLWKTLPVGCDGSRSPTYLRGGIAKHVSEVCAAEFGRGRLHNVRNKSESGVMWSWNQFYTTRSRASLSQTVLLFLGWIRLTMMTEMWNEDLWPRPLKHSPALNSSAAAEQLDSSPALLERSQTARLPPSPALHSAPPPPHLIR